MPLWEKAKRRRAVSGFRTASGRCASRSCDSCRVSSAEPTTVVELMVDLDYGHFSLTGAPIDHGSDDYSLAFDAAMEGRGIGQGGQMTVVRSQHQMNFEMPLRVEVWASEPPDDLDDWQEAFVAPIEISSSGLRYAAPTLDDPHRCGARRSLHRADNRDAGSSLAVGQGTISASGQRNSTYWCCTAVRNSRSRSGCDSARSFRSFEWSTTTSCVTGRGR